MHTNTGVIASISPSNDNNNSSSNSNTVNETASSVFKVKKFRLSSPIVFPEKRGKKVKVKRGSDAKVKVSENNDHGLQNEYRIDIPGTAGGDEKSDLLGYDVYAGKLVLDRKKSSVQLQQEQEQQQKSLSTEKSFANNAETLDARLTSKALVYGSNMLSLDDIISVSYNSGVRYFTIHAYPMKKGGLSCFVKPRRIRKDYRFLAASVDEALQWVGGFADHNCYVACLPHPLVASKKQASSELLPFPTDVPPELIFRCKNPPKMLVILNPRSGRGRSSKVFNTVVEPIFKLAGFKLEIVNTTSAGHARKLASTVDISTCPDGIICVGGDGIINEVLNGLLSRENQKEGISIPIGIIPAGSDNSLVWTVLGVRDPISAAMAIVKGGLTATDVFAVEWIQTGVLHFGMTVSYYGFVSDGW